MMAQCARALLGLSLGAVGIAHAAPVSVASVAAAPTIRLEISAVGLHAERPRGAAKPATGDAARKLTADARAKCQALLGDAAVTEPTAVPGFSERPMPGDRWEIRYLGEFSCTAAIGRVEDLALRLSEVLAHPDRTATLDRDSEVRLQEYAIEALGALGDSAARPLISLLGHSDPAVRNDAARALGRLRSPSVTVVNALVDGSSDPDERVRESALRSLRASTERAGGARAAALTTQALALLDSPRHEKRDAGIEIGIGLGAKAAPAKEKLFHLLALTPEGAPGRSPADALLAIGLTRNDISRVETLLRQGAIPRDTQPYFLDSLAQLGVDVARLGLGAPAAHPHDGEISESDRRLIEKIRARLLDPSGLLRHPDPKVREEAIDAYGAVDTEPEVKVTELVHALKDISDGVRESAVNQLAAMEPTQVLGRVMPFLEDRSARIRAAACELIERLGVHAARARDTLYSAIREFPEQPESWRHSAASALASIGLSASDYSPLMALLRDPRLLPVRRAEVIRLLGDLGEAARGSIPDLVALISKDPQKIPLRELPWRTGIDGDISAAVQALGRLGRYASPEQSGTISARLKALWETHDLSVPNSLREQARQAMQTLSHSPGVSALGLRVGTVG
jgi:HEAT repeat protein